MLDEDTPQWEHTVWILAKVRCRTTHVDIHTNVHIHTLTMGIISWDAPGASDRERERRETCQQQQRRHP